MKKYLTPDLEIVRLENSDVLTSSPGNETPIINGGLGGWEW